MRLCRLISVVVALWLVCQSHYAVAQASNQQLTDLLEELSASQTLSQQSAILIQISEFQESRGAIQKAIAYSLEAIDILEVTRKKQTLPAQYLRLARLYNSAEQPGEAIVTYIKLMELADKSGNNDLASESLKNIVLNFIEAERYQEALRYNQQYLEVLDQHNTSIERIKAVNSEGFILQKLGKTAEATQQYNSAVEAIQLLKSQPHGQPVIELEMDVLVNLAALHASSGNRKQSIKIVESIDLATLSPNRQVVRDNYLSALHLSARNLDKALKGIDRAIVVGKSITDDALLAESYHIKSEILNADGDFSASQHAQQTSQDYKDKLQNEKAEARRRRAEKEIEAERNENLIKQSISQNKAHELELNQAILQTEKAEQDAEAQEQMLMLLTREQELQNAKLRNEELEKQRIQQALLLANQKLEQQKRQDEIKRLERERALQEAAQREMLLKDKEQQQEIKLLAAENKLTYQQLTEEASRKKYLFIIIGIAMIFLTFVLFALYQRSRANKELKQQQDEISRKNEELQSSSEELMQNMNELHTAQSALKQQQIILESANLRTTQSIEYAKTIQSAILPSMEQRLTIIPNSFLIYLPKDIVSGDFYWMSEHDGKKLVGVVDCTGHGVPGAFMSLVGNNVLSDIILVQDIFSPALILHLLNIGVKEKLHQSTGANNDGMDLGLLLIEEGKNDEVDLTFAGAKNRLLYMEEGEVMEVKGNRKSVGGKYIDDRMMYEEQSLTLKKGTIVYMMTDGYVDQSNPARKSFRIGRLKELLKQICHLSLPEQKQHLLAKLQEHQGNTEQRDDITIIGIEV